MHGWMVSATPVAELFYAFRESTPPGQLIVVLLFAGSIVAWSIMVTKWLDLHRAGQSTEAFLRAFRGQSSPLTLYLQGRAYETSPLYWVYQPVCRALGRQLQLPEPGSADFFAQVSGASGTRLKRRQVDHVSGVCERAVGDLVLKLEANMSLLATAVSAAPFLGLLGTVWGVMDGFGGMAREGAATLSAVAPGISAALLTTVVGLLVALPSAIGYNLLSNQIRTLTTALDHFAIELMTAVRDGYEKDG